MKIDVTEAVRLTGVPRTLIVQVMREHGYTDAMFAAAYASQATLAVNVKGDRHAWNERRARELLQRFTGSKHGEGAVTRPKYYISGPMTGISDFNRAAFNSAAERLRAWGLEVVNPVELNPPTETDWHMCIRNDLKALCDCSHIILLDGWEGSSGAHLELSLAHRMGLTVLQFRDLLAEGL